MSRPMKSYKVPPDPTHEGGRCLLVVLLLGVAVTVTASSGLGTLALDATGTATTVRALVRVVDVPVDVSQAATERTRALTFGSQDGQRTRER